MIDDSYLKPRKVTNLNDCLDRKSYLCIYNLFCDSRAITDEIKYHDKTSNIDGFIQLIDENDLPIGNIFMFMELLTSWLNSSIENGFHEIVKHLGKCCNNYPYECYQYVKMLTDSKSGITYYDEEELLKILLTCYRKFMDDEENEKADEVMDV